MLTAVSLFAGIGGIDLALQRAGVKVVAAVEINPAARKVLARHFPHAKIFTDVREVTGDQLRAAGFVPERGLVAAGWPCQGNSVAGSRGGMADPRSGLWRHLVRLLAVLRPAWLIGENVPGLLSVNRGEDFAVVLNDLADLGMGFCWRVLDAQHVGVPQQRRRVIVVGCAGGDARGPVEVLLEPEGGAGDSSSRRSTGQVVAALTANGVGGGGGPDDNAAQAGHLIASALTAREGKGPDSDATTTLLQIPGMGVRRLTPLECERLQGFPDGWTAGQSDAARYRQLGNSVAVPCIEWITRRVVAAHTRRLATWEAVA